MPPTHSFSDPIDYLPLLMTVQALAGASHCDLQRGGKKNGNGNVTHSHLLSSLPPSEVLNECSESSVARPSVWVLLCRRKES